MQNLEQEYHGTDSPAYGWKTEYNTNRDYTKGWVYEKDGQVYWTQGQQGHFIYQELMNVINKNISNWISEYMEMQLK